MKKNNFKKSICLLDIINWICSRDLDFVWFWEYLWKLIQFYWLREYTEDLLCHQQQLKTDKTQVWPEFSPLYPAILRAKSGTWCSPDCARFVEGRVYPPYRPLAWSYWLRLRALPLRFWLASTDWQLNAASCIRRCLGSGVGSRSAICHWCTCLNIPDPRPPLPAVLLSWPRPAFKRGGSAERICEGLLSGNNGRRQVCRECGIDLQTFISQTIIPWCETAWIPWGRSCFR